MLDKRMVYSCGYWKNAKTLDQAQEDKLELVCHKHWLQPGDWAGFGEEWDPLQAVLDELADLLPPNRDRKRHQLGP